MHPPPPFFYHRKKKKKNAIVSTIRIGLEIQCLPYAYQIWALDIDYIRIDGIVTVVWGQYAKSLQEILILLPNLNVSKSPYPCHTLGRSVCSGQGCVMSDSGHHAE